MRAPGWVNRTVVGIVAATFLSDVGHEMVTAVLPMYLGSIGLGAAALGVMEGVADLLFSLSKLGGGFLGHHVARKRPWVALGYLATALGTGSMALVQSVAMLIGVRAAAWCGRGFRSPLRDFLLADAVEPTHFGRAYGIERTADMLGAVTGPLIATLLLVLHVDLRTVILVSVVPSLGSVAAIVFGTRDRDEAKPPPSTTTREKEQRPKLPRAFWLFLVGVFLFGLGDFSRTFLILLAGKSLNETAGTTTTTTHAVSVAVLLYTLHNAISAVAAFPAGRAGDRRPKLHVLLFGYGLGVLTNGLLAITAPTGSLVWLVVAIVLSGVYIAIEETIEKATAAELLPRELRSLGFGVLACANAVGDMFSSLYAGVMLDAGRPTLAFGVPAATGLAGIVWLLVVRSRVRPAS